MYSMYIIVTHTSNPSQPDLNAPKPRTRQKRAIRPSKNGLIFTSSSCAPSRFFATCTFPRLALPSSWRRKYGTVDGRRRFDDKESCFVRRRLRKISLFKSRWQEHHLELHPLITPSLYQNQNIVRCWYPNRQLLMKFVRCGMNDFKIRGNQTANDLLGIHGSSR